MTPGLDPFHVLLLAFAWLLLVRDVMLVWRMVRRQA